MEILYYFNSLRGKFHPPNVQDIFALLAEAASHCDCCAAGNTDTTHSMEIGINQSILLAKFALGNPYELSIK